MGKESQVVIVNDYDHYKPSSENHSYDLIAVVDMSKAGYDFPYLFKHEIEGNKGIRSVFADNRTTEDMYGDRLKYATIQEVLDYFDNENCPRDLKEYRRTPILIATLKSIDEKRWDSVKVFCFNY